MVEEKARNAYFLLIVFMIKQLFDLHEEDHVRIHHLTKTGDFLAKNHQSCITTFALLKSHNGGSLSLPTYLTLKSSRKQIALLLIVQRTKI